MYYITVSKGLLEAKHREKMQVNQKTSAIWMYLWLLDKITHIEGGLGQVLGGKPIKLEEIDLGYNIKTARKMFSQLEREGYIQTRRTPYGRVIWVTKAKKIFGQKVAKTELDGTTTQGEVRSESGRSDDQNVVGLGSESGRSNKTIQLDNTVNNNPPARRVDDAAMVINLFKVINPSYQLHFARKPQRAAAKRLFELHGLDKLEKVIGYIAYARGQPYFPTITTPCQLEEKWSSLESYALRQKNKQPKANIAFQ